jgi:hypothetical protein
MLESVRQVNRRVESSSTGRPPGGASLRGQPMSAVPTSLVTIAMVTSDGTTTFLECPNPLAVQSFAANYSDGSTPFGEIVAPSLPAYNRPTLVDRSPYRFRVEHGRA